MMNGGIGITGASVSLWKQERLIFFWLNAGQSREHVIQGGICEIEMDRKASGNLA